MQSILAVFSRKILKYLGQNSTPPVGAKLWSGLAEGELEKCSAYQGGFKLYMRKKPTVLGLALFYYHYIF